MQKAVKQDLKQSKLSLLEVVLDSIDDKRGEEVVILDLRQIEDAVADYFIICQADATVQVKAIADNVRQRLHDELGENPWHSEGFENLEWVLLDYVNLVVHVFLKEVRTKYQLEDLWSDAIIVQADNK